MPGLRRSTKFAAPVRRDHATVQRQAEARQRIELLAEQRTRDAEYFRRRDAEVQLLNNWSKNRFMHRSHRNLSHIKTDTMDNLGLLERPRSSSTGDLRLILNQPEMFKIDPNKVPYDLELDLLRDHKASDRLKADWSKYQLSLIKLTREHEQQKQIYLQMRNKEDELISQLRLFRQLEEQWTLKIQVTKLKLERLNFVRLSRDRLRHRAFLLAELQSFGLALLSQLQQLSSTLNNVKIGNKTESLNQDTETSQLKSSVQQLKDEQQQLQQVLKNSLQMLRRYSRISLKRNHEYSRLYSEEADFVWEAESEEWKQEKQACVALVERMLDAFASVYADRMKLAVQLQTEQLKQIQTSWNKLNDEMNSLCNQTSLAPLLKLDLHKLMQVNSTEVDSKMKKSDD